MPGKHRVLFIVMALIVPALVLSLGATIYTSRPGFCESCHEAKGAYISWTYSSHKKVHCLTCHAGATGNFAFWKAHFFKGLPHTVSHLLGLFKAPLEAATIKNEICLQCHQGMRLVSEIGNIRMEHGIHIEKGLLCTDCHAGIVHGAVQENHSPRPPMARCLACHRKRGGPVDNCSSCHLKPP